MAKPPMDAQLKHTQFKDGEPKKQPQQPTLQDVMDLLSAVHLSSNAMHHLLTSWYVESSVPHCHKPVIIQELEHLEFKDPQRDDACDQR